MYLMKTNTIKHNYEHSVPYLPTDPLNPLTGLLHRVYYKYIYYVNIYESFQIYGLTRHHKDCMFCISIISYLFLTFLKPICSLKLDD